MKLLLIEDKLAMQTALQRSFERRSIQVLRCGDGARGRPLADRMPNVVLPDLSLPGRLQTRPGGGPGRNGALALADNSIR